MEEKIISLRIDKSLHERMKALDYINWSAIIRRALQQFIAEQHIRKKEKIKKASEEIDRIRKTGIFNSGKTSVEIIREWRNKRK
jgi:Arc/MetJ-type ribon-helix-helix transcriptional regulator